MTTFIRTWTHLQNQTPSDQSDQESRDKSILLAIKQAFVAAGWVVKSSCDGTTYNASGDEWSTIADINRGDAGGGEDHSFVVLESPANWCSSGVKLWFCIDYQSGYDYRCDFYTSTADYTSGQSADSRGTGTNEADWGDLYFAPSSSGDMKFHFHTSDVGDVIFYASKDSSGYAGQIIVFNRLENAQAGDSYPVFIYMNKHTGETMFTGPTNQAYLSMSYYQLRNHNYWGLKSPWTDGTVSGSRGCDEAGSVDDKVLKYSHGEDASGDDTSGSSHGWPIHLATGETSGRKAYRGELCDIRMAIWVDPNNLTDRPAQGTVEPATGTVQSTIVGGVWIPASSAPSF